MDGAGIVFDRGAYLKLGIGREGVGADGKSGVNQRSVITLRNDAKITSHCLWWRCGAGTPAVLGAPRRVSDLLISPGNFCLAAKMAEPFLSMRELRGGAGGAACPPALN